MEAAGMHFVSFSGIDGAGKSTQIENLTRFFESNGLRVAVVTFWDDIARLKRWREGAGQKVFGGDAGVGTPEAPIERRDKNVRRGWLTLVRLALYTVDALSLRLMYSRLVRQRKTEIVIFDRYLYDELANLDMDSAPLRYFIGMMLRFAPRPDAPLILDAVPAEARARKPEYPLAFLIENRESYLRLSRTAKLIVIPPLPMEAAKSRVVVEVQLRTVSRSPTGS